MLFRGLRNLIFLIASVKRALSCMAHSFITYRLASHKISITISFVKFNLKMFARKISKNPYNSLQVIENVTKIKHFLFFS